MVFIWLFLCICLLHCSLGPLETLPREMVSRRKILSRSRDDLNLEHHHQYVTQDDEEDIWYQKDKLYKVSWVGIAIWYMRFQYFHSIPIHPSIHNLLSIAIWIALVVYIWPIGLIWCTLDLS